MVVWVCANWPSTRQDCLLGTGSHYLNMTLEDEKSGGYAVAGVRPRSVPELTLKAVDEKRGSKYLRGLLLVVGVYRDGIRRIRLGETSLRAQVIIMVFLMAVVGDELTTWLLVTGGRGREGNPIAAAGFQSIGFTWYAGIGSLLLVVIIVPLLAAKAAGRDLRLPQWCAYFGVLVKVGAVFNNLMLWTGHWHGIPL